MRKSVYLVIRVQVDCEDEHTYDHAAGEVGNECDYRVMMDKASTGISVIDTEVIGCLDECPAEVV